ncbi:MAG: hypothetical protein ACYC6L_00545 [Anaerolineae bacterium]
MDIASITRYQVTIDGESAQVGTAAELAVVLDVLQGAHDREVLEQLAPHLPGIIMDGRDLLAILKVLSTEDQLYLINTLGESLGSIVDNARILRDILAMLSANDVEEALLRQMGGDCLRQLAASPGELANLLEWLYGDGDELLLRLLGDDVLRGLFSCGSDLSQVLAMINRPLQQELLMTLGWDQVILLIHNRTDLTSLLAVLPADSSSTLIAEMPVERLRRLRRNASSWREFTAALEQREIDLLRVKLGASYAQ